MQKILYSVLALFTVWFASTACFPIYVGAPNRPEVPPLACPEQGTDVPCDAYPTPSPSQAP